MVGGNQLEGVRNSGAAAFRQAPPAKTSHRLTSLPAAGIPTTPSTPILTSGANSLRVTFTGPALLTDEDTFAYKIYGLGASPQLVGDSNGYVVPR